MKGFFKRDLCLLLLNAKFYLCFLGVFAILTLFTDFDLSFLFLYVMIFSASCVLTLFSYDEANHWGAYAAAVPNGRRAQVAARYLMGLAVLGAATALMLLLSLFSRGTWSNALTLLYAGLGLVYMALICPLQYRFGVRSRLIMIIAIAILAGGAGATGGVALAINTGSDRSFLALAALPLIAVGLVAMFLSYRISLKIETDKDL